MLTTASGAAWALWALSGMGTISSSAGTVTELELIAQPDPAKALFPGLRTGLAVVVHNNNRFPVIITSVQPGNTPISVDEEHRRLGCVHHGVALTKRSFSVLWRVPAQRSANFAISNSITMSNASETACQGATFTVPIAVSGKSDVS